MAGVLIKRRNWVQAHTGRMPCEGEGSEGGEASTSQEPSKIASKPPEAKGEAWNRFSLIGLRGNQPC